MQCLFFTSFSQCSSCKKWEIHRCGCLQQGRYMLMGCLDYLLKSAYCLFLFFFPIQQIISFTWYMLHGYWNHDLLRWMVFIIVKNKNPSQKDGFKGYWEYNMDALYSFYETSFNWWWYQRIYITGFMHTRKYLKQRTIF